MTRFLQLHVLTFYPPSNLNRDDLGRPKTAEVGGQPRLRISSQCLKRTWRTSPLFQEALAGHVGTRTKRIGSELVMPIFERAGVGKKKALARAERIVDVFGSLDKEKLNKERVETAQLVHLSVLEIEGIQGLARTLAAEDREPSGEELNLLRRDHHAADIALFGRMLANTPGHNVDAAAQVSHAFSVNRVVLEDDFFTAVDDLNKREDSGAGHVDENWFGSGVFYLYLCVNRDLLEENLSGNGDLAGRTVRALTEAVAKTSPHGKQNSYAARSRAGFIRAEKGEAQPRSLALSFLTPVPAGDFLANATEALRKTRARVDGCYESEPDQEYELDAHGGKGRLSELLDFVEVY